MGERKDEYNSSNSLECAGEREIEVTSNSKARAHHKNDILQN